MLTAKLSALALLVSANTVCVEYEIWKGGDDGLTNKVFDDLVEFNERMTSACKRDDLCETLHLTIVTNVEPKSEQGEELVVVPIEVLRDPDDSDSVISSFEVECSVASNDCAEKIFDRLSHANLNE